MEPNDFTVTNAEQIINMGGPWIGKLYFKKKYISDNVVLDNIVRNEKADSFIFVKYYHISKWQADNYFTINLYLIDRDLILEFNKHFPMIHLKQFISDDEIEIFLAFHAGLADTRRVFNIKNESSKKTY